MSLIIDALKKAQQLRLKESEGSPILKYPHPDKKKERISKKQWGLIGSGVISLSILLLILLRPTPSPLATQSNRSEKYVGAALSGRPSPAPVVEKIFPEPSKEDEESTEGRSHIGGALSGRPSFSPTAEKISQESPKEAGSSGPQTGNALNPASGGTGWVQRDTERRPHAGAIVSGRPSHPHVVKSSPEAKSSVPPSHPPANQKEETPSKSIGVEQEGRKDLTLTSDVLNHFNSGVSFHNQREFSKAIQAYRKAIELDPTYAEAYNNLGIIYQMMGDVDRAFEAYQRSTEINPMYEKGYNNLGILFLLKGRYEEALEAFQKALAINSNNVESHINLGILFKKREHWEKAIESYQKALAIDPLHRETHYNIALLYEQLEKLELAIIHYQQFIQLSLRSHPELVSKVQRHLNTLMKGREGK